MTDVTTTGTISAPANVIWEALSSFRDIENYILLVKRSTVEGSGIGAKRTCIIPNQSGGEDEIIEEIKSLDNNLKTFSYSIISSPLPVENYLSTVKVKDLDNENCEIEWSSTFEPKGMAEEEVVKMIEGVYLSVIDGLKKVHGN